MIFAKVTGAPDTLPAPSMAPNQCGLCHDSKSCLLIEVTTVSQLPAEIQITPIAASWAFHPGLFTESLADLHVKFTNKAEFMVMDYWRLKIPCLKTTWNINCGKFKNPISISKHENISGDETGFTVTKRSRAKDIPSMLLCLVFNINKHGQPLGHMHETWLICIK